jgi:hypothetical protein
VLNWETIQGTVRLYIILVLNDLLLVEDKLMIKGPSELSIGTLIGDDDLRIEIIGTILLSLRTNSRGDNVVDVTVLALSVDISSDLNETVSFRWARFSPISLTSDSGFRSI